MSFLPAQPFPVDYRIDLLRQVMAALKIGECVSLLGTSGVGKSNLVQALCQSDIQQLHWSSEPIWMLPIDINGLVFGEYAAEYVSLELLIHRLVMEAEARSLPADVVSHIADLHGQVIQRPGAALALRVLERILTLLCNRQGQRLVFLFDQFDDLWRSLDSRFFLNLRYLRDQFKYRLGYLLLTRRKLTRLRDDLSAVEAFYELFPSHTYGLGMFSRRDAQIALVRLAERKGLTIDEAFIQHCFELSGGHSGLLRACFYALIRAKGPRPDRASLSGDPAVIDECRKLWIDLTPAEQRVVRGLVLGAPAHLLDQEILRELQLLEIIAADQPQLFTPLFEAYIAAQPADDAGVVIDLRQRLVWLDGMPIAQNLSPLEFALLTVLARQAGDVVRREAIVQALYGERALEINDERLDTIVRRVREALGEDARSPRYLITHRGVGFQLTRARVEE